MDNIKDLTDQQLFLLEGIVNDYENQGIYALKLAIQEEINDRIKRSSVSMNESLDISKMMQYGLLDMFELVVLTENNIRNMKELVEADLESLRLNGESIPVYIKESLRFKRKAYDFSGYDSNGVKTGNSGYQYFKKPQGTK